MPSIKRDHGPIAIQVVKESRGRTSHGNQRTSKAAPQTQTRKRNPKSKGHSHKGTERYLSLSNDNGRNLDLSSVSSLSTKSAFARLGTQSVVTQVGRSLTNVPNSLSSKFSCHSLCNGTRKQVVVEKHSPPRKTTSKLISPSFPNPTDLGSLENISGFNKNFHSVNNPGISAPSVQHKQPEIVTVITKEPRGFEQQLPHNFEEELLPALDLDQLDNRLPEEVEPEYCYNKENENFADPQNQIPAKVSTNVLDFEVINLDLPNGGSASETTSPVEDKAAEELLEDKPVRGDEISVVRQKESRNPDKEPEQNDCCPCRGTALMQKTVSTVAAATAAAFSAHPLLASHNRLEAQLMTLLDKMNSLEQQIFLQKHEMEKEGKLQKLESQLSEVTKDRMNSLELLQRQMFGMQTNFLNVAKNFEEMFGHVPDNVQQKINENEEKTEPLDNKSSQNVQRSKSDIEMSKEVDSLESLDFAIDTDEDVRSFPRPLFLTPEDKHTKTPPKEHHVGKTSSKSASRVVHSKDSSAPSLKPKVNSNNPLSTTHKGSYNPLSTAHKGSYNPLSTTHKASNNPLSTTHKGSNNPLSTTHKTSNKPLSTTHKGSNVKKNIASGKESKSTSKANKTGSLLNSTSKSQNSRSNKNKKYQSNVQEEKLVIKELNGDIQKPASVNEKHSAKELPLKYSYLKTFSSNPYSKEPYAVRETPKAKRVPKKQSSPAPAILNTSYVISSSPELQQDEKRVNKSENQNSNSKKWFSSQSVAPLEKYLLDSPLKTQLFTSDKIYADLKSTALSAELVAGQEILQRAQTSRMFLEENLKNLERDYKKDAVYNIVDNLYQSSPASQTYQMKRKVDQCIAKMQIDIQKELSMEEATSNKLSSSNPATKVNKSGKKKDSEDLNGLRQKQPKVTVKTKENPPESSNKNLNALYQDQEYLTQVFGKATYQNKRTTVREPYLHIRNKPQVKATQPKAMVDVKGVQKKSTKVQTVEEVRKTVEKGTGVMVDDQKYFFASKPNNNTNYLQSSSLVPGHLGYMAVSLREPRMDSGLTHAVTVRPGSSVVVAPHDQPKVVSAENVVLCTVPFVNEPKPTKKPILSKQDLPSVDIVGNLSKDKVVKNVNFTTDSQDKNVLNTSFEKSVMIAECTDNEEEISCERFSEGSDIVEAGNDDVKVVVVKSKAKETSESFADNNNSNRTLPQQLQLLTGLTSELMLTKNHKIAATLATAQGMPIDAESIQQEETLNEIIQLVEQEILSQIISSDQVTPSSSVDHLKKNFLAENNAEKQCISKLKSSASEDSLIMSQLIEEILADKVGTILANDYALNVPTSANSPKSVSPNQFEKGEIPQIKSNEYSSLKQDAVCQTSLLLKELVLEDKNSHFTDKTPESEVISHPLQHTSIKEPVVPVDTAIPSESKTIINQDGSNSSIINEALSYSANEIKLNLNKNSVEQEEKTGAQETNGNPEEVSVKSYSPDFAEDSNKSAAKDLTENIVQPVSISVMSHPDDGAVQNTIAASKQSSKSLVQPTSSFVMQPSTSKVQETNVPVRFISVVAQDTVNISGRDTRWQSEAEHVEEVQRRRRREATLAKLRIDKMESIYIPPDNRVRSPVRHVKLVEITSKSLNETNSEGKDQFITPSLPSQLPPSSQSSPPSPPQQPASQLLPQPRQPHKTTSATSQTTSSLQFPSSPKTTPPPSSIAQFQTPGAGKDPSWSLFSPEKLESPEKITDEQVKELGENSTVASLEGLNLAPKFDADNDNDVEEILGTDNEVVTDSSPSSDKASSVSLSSASGSSNTALESLSDGQWLLSQSEGQAALYTVNDGVYKRILADVSNPSTLKDSNELTRDDTADITYSDGEFVLQQRVPPEKDPLLQLLLKTRKPTLNPAHIHEIIAGNTDDADAEGQRSPGEWVLSSSEIGQATFETSSGYVAAVSTNVRPENSNKMAKTVLPQQASSSRQSHIYSSDKNKMNSRVIFVGLTPDEDATAAKSESGSEIQQDQTPVVQGLLQNESFQPKAPISAAGHPLPSQQSFMQPNDLLWSKSVRFSQYREIDPIVSDNVSYDKSQHVDTSVESDFHNMLFGDGDDLKDAQSLPRPPLVPHRIPVTIPSQGEIWDDDDIEELSFQDGI